MIIKRTIQICVALAIAGAFASAIGNISTGNSLLDLLLRVLAKLI